MVALVPAGPGVLAPMPRPAPPVTNPLTPSKPVACKNRRVIAPGDEALRSAMKKTLERQLPKKFPPKLHP